MPTPPTAAQVYEAIADCLDTLAKETQGKFSRATDPFHVVELLQQAPGVFRVILSEEGDEPVGDRPWPSIVKTRWKIVVSMNRGLPSVFGQKIAAAFDGTQPSLLDRTAAVRDRVRGLVFADQTTSKALRYEGRAPVAYQGAPLDAYELTFSLLTALPEPTEAA